MSRVAHGVVIGLAPRSDLAFSSLRHARSGDSFMKTALSAIAVAAFSLLRRSPAE